MSAWGGWRGVRGVFARVVFAAGAVAGECGFSGRVAGGGSVEGGEGEE